MSDLAAAWDAAKPLQGDWEAAAPKKEPSTYAVAVNAGNKGMAGIPDAFLNTGNRVWNLLKAGVGTAATAAGRPDLAPDLTPEPNLVHRAFKGMGLIRDEAEPSNAKQRIVDTIMQGGVGMAANPAGSLRQMLANTATGAAGGAAAGGTKEITGSDQAAIAAGMLAPTLAQKAGGMGRAKVEEQLIRQRANEVRDATLKEGQEAGYVIPPSAVNPSKTNKILESIAGKAAVGQEAAIRNQPVTNKLAAQELGYAEGTPITKDLLNKYRNDVAQPYREVADLSPAAATALERLKEARYNARDYEKHYNVSADPKSRAEAKKYGEQAEMLETELEKMAVKAGKLELVDQLRASRQKIAKSYDIENGLNIGNADVSAPSIGRSLDGGAKMTGNLETIGKFQQAFPTFNREAASIPTPGVSKSAPVVGAILGTQGAGAAGAPGMLAGGLPLLSGPARSLVLSPTYQKYMAKADYSPGMIAKLMSELPPNTPPEVALQSLLLSRAVAERGQ
jgi:hypothetical protein